MLLIIQHLLEHARFGLHTHPMLSTATTFSGAMNGIVFRKNLATVEEIEEFICLAYVFISVDTLQRVNENFILCAAKDAHFESIVM